MENLIWLLTGAIAAYILIRFVDTETEGRRDCPACRTGFAIVEFQGLKIKGVITDMELKEGYKVTATIAPTTAAGHPAAIEPGSGRWSTTDESVVSVTPNPDNELEATFESLDGSTNESVATEFRADGIRGEGVKEIVITGSITATQGDAVTGEMVFGTPEPVTPATADVPAEPPPADVPAEPAPTE